MSWYFTIKSSLLPFNRPNGIAAAYRNDLRQEHVNHVAEHVGSGTGTARFVGVPGTGHDFGYNHHGYAGYPYHHGDFGYQGYGHGYDNGYNNHGYYGGY